MMYYIDKVNTWSPANRKCLEVQSYVKEFRQTLIHGDEVVEAIMKDIRAKVDELNEAYPRTKRLVVRKDSNFVSCKNEESRVDDQYVFTFHIEKVRKTYKTLEMMVDEKEKGGVE